MDRDEQTARDLELNRNEVKWYESVQRTAEALRKARQEGRDEGYRPSRTHEPSMHPWMPITPQEIRDFYAGRPLPQADGDNR